MHPRLILASASPRRASLMREHGFDITVVPPLFEEPQDIMAGMTPVEYAESLSFYKASSVADIVGGGWVLGGDTIVVLNDRIYGKPNDREDAQRILLALGGTRHQVITGVTLLDVLTRARLIRHDVTAVTMRLLAAKELEDYLNSGQWQGKAGAYGIQDADDPFVERIQGSFTNVVGFPMELVHRMLEEFKELVGLH